MKRIGKSSTLIFALIITAVSLLSLPLLSCRTNPATGEKQLNFLSTEEEIQLGRQSDEQIVQTMGVYPDENLQSYVKDLGHKLAQTSERPQLPWTFRVVDDSTVNAFALPGGFIYVTRGILAHLNNEAELAGVLGHEIGHVTAEHTANRLSKQQLSQLGLGVAMILAPSLRQFAPLASLGMQLLFLKFSREDERQADTLGVRYMSNIDENPHEMVRVMETLGRVSQQQGSGRVPEWLSTHPAPENRQENIREDIQKLDKTNFAPAERRRYLQTIDGIVYGADPREGFVRDGIFYHPELRFRMDFPQEWRIINQKQAVIAVNQNQTVAIQLTIGQANSLDEVVRSFANQDGVNLQNVRSTRINGLESRTGGFSAQTDQGMLAGQMTFISYDGKIYQIIGYAMQQNWPDYEREVMNTMFSFMELVERSALSVQPLRLDIVRVDRSMTLSEFNARYPSPGATLDEIALINQMQPETMLTAGELVKRVEGEKTWE